MHELGVVFNVIEAVEEIAKENEYAGKAEDEALIIEKYDYFLICLEESIRVVSKEI